MLTKNSFKYNFNICRADKPGWVWSEFQETVPMSTYLVAFMVSEFDFRQSDPEPNNVVLRVWARQEAIDQVQLHPISCSLVPIVQNKYDLSVYANIMSFDYWIVPKRPSAWFKRS